MISEKKCDGTGKAKGYGCGRKVDVKLRKYGLGKMCCYAKWLYESDAGKVELNKALNKVQKPRLELEKAEKEHKDSKTLGKVIKQTQDVFNRYIRLRDKYKPCISSNEPWRIDFEAGHYYSVKQYNYLRFDEDNVHGQSIGDNRFKEGNLKDYTINLKNRIGIEAFTALEIKAEESKRGFKRWSREELADIRKMYDEKIKELIKQQ